MNTIELVILGVIGTIFLALCIWIGVDQYTISGLRTQLQTAHDQTSACDTANNTLQLSIQTQNNQIKTLTTEAEQRAAEADKAVAAAATAANQNTKEGDAIISEKTDSGDDCTAAKQVLQKYLAGRHP